MFIFCFHLVSVRPQTSDFKPYLWIGIGTLLILIIATTVLLCILRWKMLKTPATILVPDTGRAEHWYKQLKVIKITIFVFPFLFIMPHEISDVRAAETVYEEIRDSHLDADESLHDSYWSDEFDETSSNPSDVINYYIQPVNEYENTVLTLYENYMESQGYQDPVCAKDECKEKKQKAADDTDVDDADAADDDEENRYDNNENNEDYDDDGEYEIPETNLTYDIQSNSPVQLFLFVDLDSLPP